MARAILVVMQDPVDLGYESADAAALAGWAPAPGATPRGMSVDVRGRRAEVPLEVGAGYPDVVHCYRMEDGWHEACSGNGPSPGWDDPTVLAWPDSA